MTSVTPPNLENIISKTSDLGNALKALFQSGGNGTPCSMHINDLLEIAASMNIDSMIGALRILSILGIVVVDNNGVVRTTSKYARFALGSLSEFLLYSLPLSVHADVDADEERYMTQFIGAMESIRRDKIGISPIYSVEIVNVIIKGKQIRNFQEQDVYLHVYHPDWKAYHLIGLGKRGERSIEELANRAMKVKLKLQPFQYVLDLSVNPKTVSYTDISGSHGAITKYTINAKVVRSFSIEFNSHMKELIEKPNNDIHESTFRWFTIEEIERGVSDDHEYIMPSTPILMHTIDLKLVKEAAGKVDHLQKKISIRKEISNRLDIKKAIIYGGLALFFFIITIFSDAIFVVFFDQIPLLENFSNITEIVTGLATIIALIIGYKKST